MDILTNIDDNNITMDSYNEVLDTGYLMINDGKEMYSIFFVYNEELENEIINAFNKLDDEDIFNMMAESDADGLVYLGIEDEELVMYTEEIPLDSIDDIENIEANNYYNDDISDFINDLKQLEASDVVKIFIFKNTKSGDLFISDSGELDGIISSLNSLDSK